MEYALTITYLSALILLETGFFAPQISLFWMRSERTEPKSTAIYGLVYLLVTVFAVALSIETTKKLLLYTVLVVFISVLVRIILLLFNYSEYDIRSKYLFAIAAFVCTMGVLLPFHYVPERATILMKSHLTLSNTMIFESDIEDIIQRYNNSQGIEKRTLESDPLVYKLMEAGIIVEVKE
jgi:hypothetical protein